MATNEYHFLTVWRIPGDVEEIKQIMANGPDLARWWPAVYLDVRELAPGDETGVGKVIDLYTKGWLPYTLRWQFQVTEVRSESFALEASGDFVGRGIWTFAQDGSDAMITYDWKIRADKPVLRYLSFLFKPIFAANHHWAMARGEESLRLELARRHATTAAERERVPPPPPPTSAAPALLAALCAGLGLLALAARRYGQSRR